MISYFLPWSSSSVSNDTTSRQRRSSVSSLLRQYETPGVAPISSRVDPQLLQRERRSLTLGDAWRVGAFVAVKATELTREFVSHHVWGPRKKSWGIEMTMITSMLRNAGKQSHLTDVSTLRALMRIAGWVPIPSDALVTPVTFRVHRRGLRGFLSEYDAAENGRRELEGEWVIGRRLWQRLQAEFRTSQSAHRSGSDNVKRSSIRQKERVILYLHGGAYYVFNAATHRVITIPLSKYTESRVFAINYRLAPETRFPGPLHDVVLAYLRLTKDLNIPSQNILIAGDSAGGGLTLALLMYLRDNDYPLPAGAILMSPWVDLTMSCDSWDSNAAFDVVPFPPDPTDHLNPVACYLGRDGMEKYLTHPYASPLFGNFAGLPPLLVQAGEAEVLRDEITLLAHKATLAGVQVQHELYEDAVHVFQMFPFLSAARKSFSAARHFVHHILPLHQSSQLNILAPSTERKLEQELKSPRSRLVSGLGEVENVDRLEFDRLQEVKDETELRESEPDDDDEVGVRRADTPPNSDTTFPTSSSLTSPQVDGIPHSGTAEFFSSEAKGRTRHKRFPTISNSNELLDVPQADDAGRLRSYTALPTTSRSRPSQIMTSTQLAPPPTTRSRTRVRSHPDIKELCKDWMNRGPANETTTYKPA